MRQPRLQPNLLAYEKKAHAIGYKLIAGVDEAGRGPLAGPVVAAACLIQPGTRFVGINDSKLLSPQKRKHFFEKLTHHPKVVFGIGISDHTLIDQINILQATKVAMLQALEALSMQPDYILIDAVKLSYKGIPTESIIRGDQLSQSIAAASIIAKETRDEMMRSLHRTYPAYGFDQHKGYGTRQHLEALEKFGPCSIHRRSFKTASFREG